MDPWEARWAAYDEATYQQALSLVRPDDIVLDIGAGDLRFTRRVAQVARQVYAIEQQARLLADQSLLPANLTVICADARRIAWPPGISLGLLLMRHCTHVGLYLQRLRQLGCARLITNARWRFDVELIDLGPQAAWSTVKLGWYACTCGQTGFVAGPPSQLRPEHTWRITSVEDCPACNPPNQEAYG